MTRINPDKKTDEIKQLMKIQFTLFTLIIIAITTAFGVRTHKWVTAVVIATALLTTATLFAPLIYSRTKQLAIKFADLVPPAKPVVQDLHRSKRLNQGNAGSRIIAF